MLANALKSRPPCGQRPQGGRTAYLLGLPLLLVIFLLPSQAFPAQVDSPPSAEPDIGPATKVSIGGGASLDDETLFDDEPLIEGRLKVDGSDKTYEQSLTGLRSYLNSNKADYPEVYQNLDPHLASLEQRNRWGWTLAVAGPLGGAGLGLAGAYAFPSGSGNQEQPNLGLFFGGVALGLVTGLTGFWLMPGFHDLDRFIERHNRLVPKRPMRIEYLQSHSAQDAYRESSWAYGPRGATQTQEEDIYRITLSLFF